MQVTIEIPDEWAEKLQRPGRPSSAKTELAREVIEFLARGPQPNDIVAFRPSAATMARAGELLDKNRESTLTTEERLELNEISAWNRFFSLLKAQARLNLAGLA
jgi:hypothetical protein